MIAPAPSIPKHDLPPGTECLKEIGDRELPDADPNESQRQALKDVARVLRARFTARELAYLAGAVEFEAFEKRAREERPPAA